MSNHTFVVENYRPTKNVAPHPQTKSKPLNNNNKKKSSPANAPQPIRISGPPPQQQQAYPTQNGQQVFYPPGYHPQHPFYPPQNSQQIPSPQQVYQQPQQYVQPMYRMPTGQPVPQPYYNSHAPYPTHSQPQDQNKPPNHPSNFPPSLTKQSIQTKSPYAPMYISTPVNAATPAKLKTVATYYQGCFTDEELFLGVKVGNGYSSFDKPENIEMEAPIIEKAKKGDAEALYQLGKKYNSRNAVRAMAWFQKAAAAAAAGNHSAAQLEIGKLYVSSHRGIEADGALAKEWLVKAHQNGEKDAALQLGDMYHLGKIVPKDYKLAMEWYLKSPDTKCITLLARIGIMYKKGHGVPKDENTAQEYFTKASQIGYFDAANQLGEILDSSQEMGDREEAMKWYKEGYFQGSDNAAIRLHEIYDSDPKYMNTKDAAEWFYRGTYSNTMDRDDNEKILRRMSHFLSASARARLRKERTNHKKDVQKKVKQLQEQQKKQKEKEKKVKEKENKKVEQEKKKEQQKRLKSSETENQQLSKRIKLLEDRCTQQEQSIQTLEREKLELNNRIRFMEQNHRA